jgi:beta-glucosidase
VRNTGRRAGREIVQIYVREQRPRLRRPEQELKAFASVMLEPGEARVVRFTLSRRDFAFFDPQANAWTVTAGTFDILAGASSREIRLRASVAVRATQPAARPHFDRYSRVETFMAYAEGRAFLGSRLSKALLGPETGEAEPETPASDEVASDPFLLSLPIGRLVVLGTLTEQEMQAIVDCLNADD